MKFLLDENISTSLYLYLKSRDFDVKRVGTDIQSGITDINVLNISIKEKRIIITRDCGDIGEIIYKKHLLPVGVICLKGNIRGKIEVDAFKSIIQNIKNVKQKFIIVSMRNKKFELRIKDL